MRVMFDHRLEHLCVLSLNSEAKGLKLTDYNEAINKLHKSCHAGCKSLALCETAYLSLLRYRVKLLAPCILVDTYLCM